uniref:RNA ligase domain-containing protein n=1 Tax=Rhizophagus irregularis (strain DAOM 181602 / DAOM 197198 / MUCL 43194) TaxID=747089 RepID=U9SP78_RHIID
MTTIDSSTSNEWWNINKHVKYHAIETTSNSKRVEIFKKENLLDKCEWVVTEKVHGSNFSFITNGKEIKCASRLGLLTDSTEYYGFQNVKERYYKNIIKLWDIMLTKNLIKSKSKSKSNNNDDDNLNDDDEKVIIIFGELFGGRYSHPDVKPIKNAIMCQFGIDYCPQNDFLAFDIYDGKDFLNYDIMIDLFKESELPYLKPLFRGSFNDAFNYNPDFITTIPDLMGLPPLPFQNRAEGVIIKPVLTIRAKDKDRRVILKIKTTDFVERVRTKKREYKEESRKKSIQPMNEIVCSVVSKFGPIIKQNQEENIENKLNERINQVTLLLFEDALIDLYKDDELKEKFENLPIYQQEIIKEKIKGVEALNVVKDYVEKIKNDSDDNILDSILT